MSDLPSTSHRLESFLLMAKSAKGAAAAKLIESVTSAPGVFVFAELLDNPNIQELEFNPQFAPHVSLLKLFSYGTFAEYKEHKDALPPLNPAQLTKLKNLSIVSLASKSRILPYAQLRSYLDITTIRELEDLIIDAMYQDVLRGKLDQKDQQLEVEYTMGRDLRPGQLEDILAALKNWSNQTAEVISALDTKIAQVVAHHEDQKEYAEAYEAQKVVVLQEVASAKRNKRTAGDTLGGSAVMGDEMDVDPPPSQSGGLFNSLLSDPFGTRKKKTLPSGQNTTSSGNGRKRNRP